MSKATLALMAVSIVGCSHWKIRGGPPECHAMCDKWGLKFAGMVGVGDQDPTEPQGATACICLDPSLNNGALTGAGGSSASLSGPIAAATAAVVQEQMRQEHQRYKQASANQEQMCQQRQMYKQR